MTKCLQKVKLLGHGVFPERLNFTPGLAGKFCKELATLHNNASLHYFSSASLKSSVGSSWMPILIRIGIRSNDADPTGSGSTTLLH
jgi:hypothetical protein